MYLIALLLPDDLASRVSDIKREFAERYNCRYALNVVPHITLQEPFRCAPGKLPDLVNYLEGFSQYQYSFNLKLEGFGAFNNPEKRVIYINVKSEKLLSHLHKNLKFLLRTRMHFSEELTRSRYTPHVTVAYRDLDKEAFEKAWPVFRTRPFSAEFPVNTFCLLKHSGGRWQKLSEFSLAAYQYDLFA
ncbi:MAG TPA: 2'-5' RNA ligase family protein [Anseongella sp.]|nr:2'-5' RNA ligase family protein [Anseongella sp.]